MPYTAIGVTGEWLVIACKCTIWYAVHELLSSLNFGQITDGQMDGQTAMHKHRYAQN